MSHWTDGASVNASSSALPTCRAKHAVSYTLSIEEVVIVTSWTLDLHGNLVSWTIIASITGVELKVGDAWSVALVAGGAGGTSSLLR